MMPPKQKTSSRLRHRLTLQQEVQTPDGAGGSNKSWADVTDLWAEIIPITGSGIKGGGKEIVFGDQVEANISHRILLRYRDGVTPDMRLVFESRIFNIRYVVDVNEMRENLTLLVQEGVAT